MRLIDADKLGFSDFEIVMCEGSFKAAFEILLEKINSAPSIETPEVIRCEECEWWDTESEEKYRVCYNNTSSWKADDFCSYGRKKGELDESK